MQEMRGLRPNIFPALRYSDARAAIEWLVRAFGFEKLAVHDGPERHVMHAELAFGSGVVALGTASAPTAANPWSTVRHVVYARVSDVDAHHDRAKQGGAEIVMPLTDMPYGSREYGARDPEGHVWGFGTYDMARADGEPNIFPELHYPDGAAAVMFLTEAFGFAASFKVPGPDGNVMHAEMQLGDGIVMCSATPDDHGMWCHQNQAVSIMLDDPDAHFARATAAGATIVQPPADTPYGARAYWARDLEGFLWGFSTYRPAAFRRQGTKN
jgi:uncharacterized glyoxalase superfamily protein PhnB